jgi:hypothetical protein
LLQADNLNRYAVDVGGPAINSSAMERNGDQIKRPRWRNKNAAKLRTAEIVMQCVRHKLQQSGGKHTGADVMFLVSTTGARLFNAIGSTPGTA